MVNEFHRPDEKALKKCLHRHADDANGVAVRLAWLAGLTRGEIHALTWEQVDFRGRLLRLPDRDVPLCGDLAQSLKKWSAFSDGTLPYVMVSRRRKKHIMLQALTRLVRDVMEESGQGEVGLLDLRYDFVRRALLAHDWPYVLRITGFSVTTYRNKIAGMFETASAPERKSDGVAEEYLLWKLLRDNRDTPAGIALWLSHRIGLSAEEIVSLTWAQVDFDAPALHLSGRDVPLPSAVARILSAERARRAPDDDPHVILTPRTRKPVTAARLSTMVRTVLIRGGVETQSLRELRRGGTLENEKHSLLDYANAHGSISRAQAMALLGLSADKARSRLSALAREGGLVRINSRYYPADAIVLPEQQMAAIRQYLEENGGAYCSDVAALLHIGRRSAARLLRRMTERGELSLFEREKQYFLNTGRRPVR